MISVKLLYRRPDGATTEGVPITTGTVAIQAVRRYDTTVGEMTTAAFTAAIGSNVSLDAGDWRFTLLRVPNGVGGFLKGTDAVTIRSVPSAVPTADIPAGKVNGDGSVDVDDLPEVPAFAGGTGGTTTLPADFLAQFAALQAQVNALSVGTAPASLATITGASTDGKALIATPNTFGDMRTLLGAASAGSVTGLAPLASPALTGAPTAPTPTAGDNDNSIATTAFVQGELTAGGFSLASPAFTGNPTAPTPTAGDADTSIATTAFVDTSFAKKASPTFTGVPAAPTATMDTNTTQLATTAFVQAAVAAAAANTFYVWVPVSGAFPARPATTQHLAFLSSTVTPTLDGSVSGGGGMVPNYDIWIRALP